MTHNLSLPSLLDHSPVAFVEEMRRQIPALNSFLLHFKKLQVTRPTSAVDDMLFLQEYCLPFEDHLEHLEVTVGLIQNDFEKTGVDRGRARRSAISSDLGEMKKKYQRVYDRLPSRFKPGSSTKTLKRILDEETKKLASK